MEATKQAYLVNKYEFAAKATAVASTVVSEEQVVFYAGSMFVKCTTLQSAKIKGQLIEAMKCGVSVSRVGPEYAFDFTV